jgi:hypothetical protein
MTRNPDERKMREATNNSPALGQMSGNQTQGLNGPPFCRRAFSCGKKIFMHKVGDAEFACHEPISEATGYR